MAIRLELFAPGMQFMSAEQYNQVFTLHGAVMVFLFIILGILAALGNVVLPLMLGKDVAFPRLNLGASTSDLGAGSSCTPSDQGARHRLDLLHPVLDHGNNTAVISATSACSSWASARSSRAELPGHHPQDAAAGDDLAQAAALPVGDVRHCDHADPGHPVLGITLLLLIMESRSASVSSTRTRAVTRSCTSTSSGSTATRRSTS